MGLTDLFIILILAVAITSIVTKSIDKMVTKKIYDDSEDIVQLSRLAYKNDIADNSIHIVLSILWFVCNYFFGETTFTSDDFFGDYLIFALGCLALNFNFLRFLIRDFKKVRENTTEYYVDVRQTGFGGYSGTIRKDNFAGNLLVIGAGFAVIYLIAPIALLITSIIKIIRIIKSYIKLKKLSDHISSKKKAKQAPVTHSTSKTESKPQYQYYDESDLDNIITAIPDGLFEKIMDREKHPYFTLCWTDKKERMFKKIDTILVNFAKGNRAVVVIVKPTNINVDIDIDMLYAFMVGIKNDRHVLMLCSEEERRECIIHYEEIANKDDSSFNYISEEQFEILNDETIKEIELKWDDGLIHKCQKEAVVFIDAKYGDKIFIVASKSNSENNLPEFCIFMLAPTDSKYYTVQCNNEKYWIEAYQIYRRIQTDEIIDTLLDLENENSITLYDKNGGVRYNRVAIVPDGDNFWAVLEKVNNPDEELVFYHFDIDNSECNQITDEETIARIAKEANIHPE